MLEKIEMAPGELLEVVGLAQHPTDRAGVLGSPVGCHLKEYLMRCLAGVHPLPHQPPRGLQAKAQGAGVSLQGSIEAAGLQHLGRLGHLLA